MCTLLVWKNVHPRYPLVAAANRDEYLNRPAAPAGVLHADPLVVGGRDLHAGGTWLALNEHGVLAALTNRVGPRDLAKRSRGAIVLSIAASGSFVRARAALAALDSSAYNPFALLVADASQAIVAYGGGADETMRAVALDDGPHALTNWELDADSPSKAESACRAARTFRFDAAMGATDIAEALHALLALHAGPASLCVHRTAENYGTRSSAVVLLARDSGASLMFAADGPPCTSILVDVSGMLHHDTKDGTSKIAR
jgi:uncharacterized protein with NRDE domain